MENKKHIWSSIEHFAKYVMEHFTCLQNENTTRYVEIIVNKQYVLEKYEIQIFQRLIF